MKIQLPKNLNTYTKTAIKAALHGGEILKRHYNKNIKVVYKGEIDPVTQADKQTQKAVFSIIKKAFPHHTNFGEEDKKKIICSEYCWIVDPLDGTVNFIHNVPVFCISIGLSHKGRIISGVVYAPLLGEIFIAEKGKGAWLNNIRIKVSKTSRLVRSLVVTGFPYNIHSDSKRVIKNFSSVLTKAQGIRRLGSAAMDLAYVACGRFDAFWEEGLKPWDVAAGSLLVKEAGGSVTDYKNGTDYLYGQTLLASNKKIHNLMLRLIK